MKKLILFTFLFLSLSTSILYSQFNQEWVKSYPIRGQSLALDSAGNSILVGFRGSDICTIKYNSSGQIIWARDSSLYLTGAGIKNAVDKNGNVYVSLQSSLGRFYLIKYDSSGHQKWNNHDLSEWNECHGIALDSSGNIFVICQSLPSNAYEYLTIKYSSSGDTIWSRRYRSSYYYGGSVPRSIYVDLSGNVYVTGGSIIDTIRTTDYVSIKYNDDGALQWISYYNGRVSGGDEANSVFTDNRGYCYVTGNSTFAYNIVNSCTIKYNNYGDSLWTRYYPTDIVGGYYDQFGKFIIVDSQGNVFIAGSEMGIGNPDSKAITALKYDKYGNLIWYKLDTTAVYIKSAVLDKNSNFYLIGDGRTYMKGVGYDSSGNVIWNFQHTKIAYAAVKIVCNRNGDLYLLSTTLDTAMLFKFSSPTIVRNENNLIIKEFKLEQNYPNPFNPETKIKFDVVSGFPLGAYGNDKVVLKVYDILGKEIATFVNESLKPGSYEVTFDGSQLPSGVYLYKLTTEGFSETKKMLMIK